MWKFPETYIVECLPAIHELLSEALTLPHSDQPQGDLCQIYVEWQDQALENYAGLPEKCSSLSELRKYAFETIEF